MIINNRLSVEYIKKIFHFMKMNNVDEVKVKDVLFKKGNQYMVKIFKGNLIKESFYNYDLKNLVLSIKDSEYYMMKFIKEEEYIEEEYIEEGVN